MGVNVRATKPDTTTAAETVRANSRKSRPVVPLMKATGTKTAATVIVMAITANAISLLPSNAACRGGIPCSMRR